ncbi:uncharacterized protein LOC111311475 isoform X1 [Durio zibethinus]|uniref:Uncharacterized protein LOC111311475 isoform X1 n=1 Tax=Durio zibethinus TaxID=66656 RepID=A0A6P6AP74_DURZI|nr:uncharacterized protein LOC111311475 isoform X1 [Durio zibethinus]
MDLSELLAESEPFYSQKLPTETCSDNNEDGWGSVLYWPQRISGGAVPNQISNVGTPQASQSPNISDCSLLKRNVSSLSEPDERTQRKREIDQAYRQRCKADPVRLENEKLKDENALLKKNANLNSYLAQLSEENAKLRTENKVLKVQNDALCGKIISDNDKNRE